MTDATAKKVNRETFERNLSTKTIEELRGLSSLSGLVAPKTSKDELIALAWSKYSGEPLDKPIDLTESAEDILEGRVSDERPSFRRAGFTFGRQWNTLEPQPTAEQLAILKQEPAIRIRIKKAS
jgi:hypothetical protein